MPLPTEFPDLNQMFGKRSAMPTFFGLQQMEQAKKIQQQNMMEQSQNMDIQRQKAPADLASILAQTEESKARVPFLQEQTNQLKTKNQIDSQIPADMRKQAAIAELASKISEDELKDHENKIRQALLHHKPEVRQTAQFMWEALDKVKMKKMELDNQKEIQRAHDERIEKTTRETNEARIRQAEIRAKVGKQALTMEQAAMSGKLDPARAAVALSMAAEMVEDPAEKADLFRRANQMETMAQKLRPQPGPQVDPSQMPGVPLKTPGLPGPSTGPAASTPPQASPGAEVGIPSPKTQAEYDKLPSGTIYIDTDGKKKRKK